MAIVKSKRVSFLEVSQYVETFNLKHVRVKQPPSRLASDPGDFAQALYVEKLFILDLPPFNPPIRSAEE